MKILELKMEGYRNLEKSKLVFNPGINFIYGKNAQGKTNLIEAVWMFTGARSFRGTKDLNLVNFEKENARIEGKFFFEKRDQEISVFFGGGKRKVFLNGVAKPYPTSIIGKLRVVVFSPLQISLISGGPEGRRKFLDAAICQLKPTYISKVVRYNQILKNRNAVLKNIGLHENEKTKVNQELLEVWNEKLLECGSEIIRERFDYLNLLKKEMKQYLPMEEASYIAMHLINAEEQSKNKTLDDERVLEDIAMMIESEYDMKINRDSFNYSRFASHIFYLLQRGKTNHLIATDNKELFQKIKKNYVPAYYRASKRGKSRLS